MSRGWKNLEMHDSRSLDYFAETVGRNTDVKTDFSESWEGNKEDGGQYFSHFREYIIVINKLLMECEH